MNSVREAEALPTGSARLWASALGTQLRQWLALPDVGAALYGTLALRIATSIFVILLAVLLHGPYVQVADQINREGAQLGIHVLPAPLTGLEAYVTSPWLRWDANHYLSIAQSGYTYSDASAFLPLYPLLIRLGSYLTAGNLVVSALLISTVATFFSFLFLYQLALRVTLSSQVARYSLLVACLLPIAFFFVAPYTESLYLALSLGCILAVLDGRWGRAALFAGVASLTRQQGVLLGVLALPALISSARSLWERRSAGGGLARRLAD